MIIVDCEIKKAILGRNETPIEGIEYCEGWRDFAGMGISCVCTYDITTNLSRAFLEEDLLEFGLYVAGKATAGFNTRRFDIPLLAANEAGPIDGSMHYDMLEQIWLALGLNPDKFNPRTHGGWGLDACCQATLGIAKTGHGALAPVWWQQGKRGKVIDYCLNDCHMEGQLLIHILQGGLIKNAAGHVVRVAPPGNYTPTAFGPAMRNAPIVSADTATDPPTIYTHAPVNVLGETVPVREGTTICNVCKRVPQACICVGADKLLHGLGIIR